MLLSVLAPMHLVYVPATTGVACVSKSSQNFNAQHHKGFCICTSMLCDTPVARREAGKFKGLGLQHSHMHIHEARIS